MAVLDKRIYFTICSANYLAYARTLEASLRACGTAAKFVLILADERGDRFSAEDLGFEVVEARDLKIPTFYDMAMRYTVMELNTAVKPFAFSYFLQERGAEDVVVRKKPA